MPDPRTSVRPDPARGFVYALGGTVFVSCNFVTAKYALGGFNGATFAFLWMSAAAVYLLVFIAATGRLRQLAVSRSSTRTMAVVVILGAVAQVTCWTALKQLDPSFTSFLVTFAPVLTILGGVIFLRERLSGYEALAVALMVFGGGVSAFREWDAVGVGVVLVAISCLASAAQRLVVKTSVHRVPPLVINFYRVSGSAVVLGVWAFLSGTARFDVGGDFWAVLLIGAFLGPVVSVVLTFESYKHWDLSRSTMVLMARPLLVLPAAFVILNMQPTRTQLAGGLVILGGAFWLVWLHNRNRRRLNSHADSIE